MKNAKLLLLVILSGVFLFAFLLQKEELPFFSGSKHTKVNGPGEGRDRADLRYDFNETADRYYNFTLNNVSMLVTPSAGQDSKKVTLFLEGGWCVSPSKKDQYSWKIDAHFQDLTIFENDIDPLLRKILAKPFSFEIDRLGYIENFRFAGHIPEKFRPVIINIVKNFQFVLPGASKNQWKAIETDGTGSFHARYTFHEPKGEDDSNRISKEKYGRIDMNVPDEGMEEIYLGTFSYESSNSTAVFDENSGWIREIEVSEKISSGEASPLLDHQLNHFSAALQTTQTACRIPEVGPENESPVHTDTKLITEVKDRAEATREPVDFAGLMDSLIDLWAVGDKEDIRKVEAHLREILGAHPEISARLIEFIDSDDPRLSSDFVHSVCLVMANVGGKEIQRNFADTMTDESMKIGTRIKLVLYANDFRNPQRHLVDNLLHIYSRDAAGLARQENSLSNMALLAVGNLGSKEGIDSGDRNYVTTVLSDMISRDSSTEEKIIQLGAAGNMQNPALAEAIKPSAASDHPAVRKTAYEALMATEDTETQFWVLDNLRSEQNSDVIEGALNSLRHLDMSPEVNAEIVRFSEETGDDEVLKNLVKVVGNNMEKYERNREVLLNIYARNPGSQVKREIFRYVQP